jgi:hypothetical protein
VNPFFLINTGDFVQLGQGSSEGGISPFNEHLIGDPKAFDFGRKEPWGVDHGEYIPLLDRGVSIQGLIQSRDLVLSGRESVCLILD